MDAKEGEDVFWLVLVIVAVLFAIFKPFTKKKEVYDKDDEEDCGRDKRRR